MIMQGLSNQKIISKLHVLKVFRSRKLLFAFVSDNDMVVNAVELMKKLEC